MEQNLGNGVKVVGEKECKKCNKQLNKKQVQNRGSFCSHTCYSEHKIGEKHSWGDKISKRLKGKPKSKEHVEKVRNALLGRKRPEISGDKNVRWKGDAILNGSLHDWIYSQLGHPSTCEKCGINEEGRMYHWANISQEYKRDLLDWMRLCVPCHSAYDREHPKSNYNKI